MNEFLRKIPLFTDFLLADLECLATMVEEVHLSAETELFAEGRTRDRAYIIKEGQLEVTEPVAEGGVLRVVRGVGEMIGELSLLDQAPQVIQARACGDCVLLVIRQAEFNGLLDSRPSAARSILRAIMPRWRACQAALQESEQRLLEYSDEVEQASHEADVIKNVVYEAKKATDEAKKAADEARKATDEAKKAAHEVNQAKNELLAIMYHELRTPTQGHIRYEPDDSSLTDPVDAITYPPSMTEVAQITPPQNTAPPTDAEVVIDLSVLEQNMGISKEEMPEMIAELMPLFFSDASSSLVELQRAVEQEHIKKIQQAAHTLRGNGASFGAKGLVRLCAEQEKICKILVENIAQIEDEYKKIRAALEAAAEAGM